MRELPHLHVALALLRDGFHPDSPGGTVSLDGSGAPVLDYPLDAVRLGRRSARLPRDGRDPVRRGCKTVMPIHGAGAAFSNVAAARAAIDAFRARPARDTRCERPRDGRLPARTRTPTRAAVDTSGRYHHLANLHVFDGSLFPTSIGANPQLSIYGIVARLATGLADGALAAGVSVEAPRRRTPVAIRVFALMRGIDSIPIAAHSARPSIFQKRKSHAKANDHRLQFLPVRRSRARGLAQGLARRASALLS